MGAVAGGSPGCVRALCCSVEHRKDDAAPLTLCTMTTGSPLRPLEGTPSPGTPVVVDDGWTTYSGVVARVDGDVLSVVSASGLVRSATRDHAWSPVS